MLHARSFGLTAIDAERGERDETSEPNFLHHRYQPGQMGADMAIQFQLMMLFSWSRNGR